MKLCVTFERQPNDLTIIAAKVAEIYLMRLATSDAKERRATTSSVVSQK
jgi:hypothetical protein